MIRRLPYLLSLAVLTAVDLWSKHAAFVRLNGYEDAPQAWSTVPVIPDLFQLSVVRNTGATFGLGSGHGGILMVLNALAILVLLWLLWRCRAGEWLRPACLTLILAGAFGNLYDRFRFGWVRDFLDVYYGTHHWPPFNVADACIVVGVLTLAVVLWRQPAPAESDGA